MKLYFFRGACSLAPHIALREAEIPFELVKVDPKTAEFKAINPKGYVPVLRFDDRQILTEVAVILQYVADQKPGSKLAPACGTMERYRLQEWLSFIGTEIHKAFGPLFGDATPEQTKALAFEKLDHRFAFAEQSLEGKQFLMGDAFTVADAYLFTMLGWARFVKIDVAKWPNLAAYHERLKGRPSVRAAFEAERTAK